MKLCMFRTVPLSIIRSFSQYAQQWYMSYRFADSLLAGSGWNFSSILILLANCKQTCMTCTIAACTWRTLDDGQRNCPKHVEFHSKIKNFEKLVHLVGSIIRNRSVVHYRAGITALSPITWTEEDHRENKQINNNRTRVTQKITY